MDQRTHSWIAIRAMALLADENKEHNLVALLLPQARQASVGAWIPDQTDAKRGGSATENHVLKIEPYDGPQQDRFTATRDVLLGRLGTARATTQFLQQDQALDATWWGGAYKGDVPKPGQHLPNRAMALSTMMKDLLLMGDPTVDGLVPGTVSFLRSLAPEARTHEEAAAMYFFMLSHFVADASMPCHCDARKLSAYSGGLHHEWETHWAAAVGTNFEKGHLVSSEDDASQILEQARQVDPNFRIQFSNAVPDLQPKQDVWLELMNVCRASFAVASIVAPPAIYKYDNSGPDASFATLFDDAHTQLLEDVDRLVIHDAVLNTAIVWKHVWKKVSKLD
jgi:hypothetical protein